MSSPRSPESSLPFPNPHHHLPCGPCVCDPSNVLSIIFLQEHPTERKLLPQGQEASCGTISLFIWRFSCSSWTLWGTRVHPSRTSTPGLPQPSLVLTVVSSTRLSLNLWPSCLLPTTEPELSYLLKTTRFWNGQVIVFSLLVDASEKDLTKLNSSYSEICKATSSHKYDFFSKHAFSHHILWGILL